MEQQNNNQKPKDPMIKFKSTTLGTNSKGGSRTQLSLSQEEVNYLVEQLQAVTTERGAKFDIHTSEKATDDGRTFLSSIAFVKGIQEYGAPKGSSAPVVGAKPAVPASSGPSLRDRVAGLKTQPAVKK